MKVLMMTAMMVGEKALRTASKMARGLVSS